MSVMFYGSAIVAILATLMVITRTNIVHALLYFIVSLLAIRLRSPGRCQCQRL